MHANKKHLSLTSLSLRGYHKSGATYGGTQTWQMKQHMSVVVVACKYSSVLNGYVCVCTYLRA